MRAYANVESHKSGLAKFINCIGR